MVIYMCKDNNFIILFSSIKKKLYKILNSKLKEYNLSIIETIYLLIIEDSKNGISFKDLTIQADCDKGMTTRVIMGLKMKKLVSFDYKVFHVTNEGKELVLRIKSVLRDFKDDLLNKIGSDELNMFYDKLNMFNNILEGELKCLN